jgi:uncharacterized protein (DUF58 family)
MRSAEGAPPEPWPDRLIPAQGSTELELGLRNLYILPSGFGWLWLAACGVLMLIGGGASSSGTLLLAYGGLALFLLSPFLTQFNLQGLKLRCGEPQPGFAGEAVVYPLVACSSAPRLQLHARFRGQRQGWSGDLPVGRSNLLVPWWPQQRGLQTPGRLRLETKAPLGLFVCWTLWQPAAPQLIYPRPLPGRVQQQAAASRLQTAGSEIWHDLAPHRAEEGLQRLAWKQLARSGQRLSKRFRDPEPQPEQLKADPALPWEQALEQLCQRCLQLAARGEPFGLQLLATRIEVGSGERQLRRCLEALALAPCR